MEVVQGLGFRADSLGCSTQQPQYLEELGLVSESTRDSFDG